MVSTRQGSRNNNSNNSQEEPSTTAFVVPAPSLRDEASRFRDEALRANSATASHIDASESPQTLEDRIASANNILRQLQQEAELAQLNIRINEARAELAQATQPVLQGRTQESARTSISTHAVPPHGRPITAGSVRFTNPFENPVEQQAANTSQEPIKEPPPKDLEYLYGKSIKELQRWIHKAERVFRLSPYTFRHDQQRVSYATQFLKGEMEDSWEALEIRIGSEALQYMTWDECKQHLEGFIADPHNRQMDAMQQYVNATQRSGQPTRSFDNYLRSLEARLDTTYSPEQLRQHLYSKLRPEIKVALGADIPTSREALVERASQVERVYQANGAQIVIPHARYNRNHQRGRGNNHNTQGSRVDKNRNNSTSSSYSGRTNSSSSSQSTRGRGTGSNTTPLGRGRPFDRSKVNCYKCNRTGHYANECTYNTTNTSQQGPRTTVAAIPEGERIVDVTGKEEETQ